MKIAFDIDNITVNTNNQINYAPLLPVINASNRNAEILFFTHKLTKLSELEKVTQLLDLIPGKTSLVLGRPKADIYLGV
ncbi:MAG: hypothetical protein GY865_13765 [candidate division Zixibacteria bacterium]|nr:hypothetical protein [candidate division Zixibacteria bacterium]